MSEGGDRCQWWTSTAQIPKDVRCISRLKMLKEGCQGDVSISDSTSLDINAKGNSFTLKSQWDL